MGIFNKHDKNPKPTTNSTIIAEGVIIKGGIESNSSVFINGKFEGVISVTETLTIGKNGEIIGEIICKDLIVNGTIDGIINAENIHILDIGKIFGKIQYDNLEIEKNGIFEGEGKKKNSDFKSKYIHIDTPNENFILEN